MAIDHLYGGYISEFPTPCLSCGHEEYAIGQVIEDGIVLDTWTAECTSCGAAIFGSEEDDVIEKWGVRHGGLTWEEREIVNMLANAYNAFCQLPVEHPMDQDEFCRAIHVLQDKVLARPGRREMNSGRTA